jgi:hypothetical protein
MFEDAFAVAAAKTAAAAVMFMPKTATPEIIARAVAGFILDTILSNPKSSTLALAA